MRAATGSRAETVATVTVSLGSGASAEGFAGAGLVAGRGAPAAEHGAAAAQGQAGATAGGSSELQARITGRAGACDVSFSCPKSMREPLC